MLLNLLQRCQYGGTFTFINAPGDGKRVNCKLERTMAWDDDEDMDMARSLKICPILVDACGIKKGEELAWLSVFPDSRGCGTRGSGFVAAAAAERRWWRRRPRHRGHCRGAWRRSWL